MQEKKRKKNTIPIPAIFYLRHYILSPFSRMSIYVRVFFTSYHHKLHRGDPMSYRIEYGSAIPSRYVTKNSCLRLQSMTAVCLLLFSLTVRHFFPEGTEKLRQLLLPGELSVTQEAIETFMCDIRNGEDFTDSLTAFCEYIVIHDETLSG